tara:strand:- start:1963 stop:2208 length:246 start_codon:yes stop_codon:yes gene_type:complete
MQGDFEISIPELDLAAQTALKTGAIASRMTVAALEALRLQSINKDLLPSLERAVKAAFTGAGFGLPNVFTVSASAGATRES